LHPDDLPFQSSSQGAENGDKEDSGGDGNWQAFFRQMKSSRMVLVMKIREGSPEDIEALILDVRVARENESSRRRHSLTGEQTMNKFTNSWLLIQDMLT